jgi:hypothetical protein
MSACTGTPPPLWFFSGRRAEFCCPLSFRGPPSAPDGAYPRREAWGVRRGCLSLWLASRPTALVAGEVDAAGLRSGRMWHGAAGWPARAPGQAASRSARTAAGRIAPEPPRAQVRRDHGPCVAGVGLCPAASGPFRAGTRQVTRGASGASSGNRPDGEHPLRTGARIGRREPVDPGFPNCRSSGPDEMQPQVRQWTGAWTGAGPA